MTTDDDLPLRIAAARLCRDHACDGCSISDEWLEDLVDELLAAVRPPITEETA